MIVQVIKYVTGPNGVSITLKGENQAEDTLLQAMATNTARVSLSTKYTDGRYAVNVVSKVS